jgi:hypothetical protein
MGNDLDTLSEFHTVKLFLERNMYLAFLLTVVVCLNYSILIPYMVSADLRYTIRKRIRSRFRFGTRVFN